MPPRPSRRGPSRPGGGPLQAGRGNQSAPSQGLVQFGPPSANVSTVGVKRPGHGRAGRTTKLLTNAWVIGIPKTMIYHYDVVFAPKKDYPVSLARELIDKLQKETAPEIFVPFGVFDGKNLFMPHKLDFGTDASGKPAIAKSFNISLPRNDPTKLPSIHSVVLTKVAEVNPEVLKGFVSGKQPEDSGVLTVLMVMNIVLGQALKSLYPSNARSFFPGDERQPVGYGLELWRGYFQSARAMPGRVILNFGITTGLVFKSGSLMQVALDFFNEDNPYMLSPINGFPDHQRRHLELFFSGMRVKVTTAVTGRERMVIIQGLTEVGADTFTFDWKDQGPTTVADYFSREQNGRALNFPGVICVIICIVLKMMTLGVLMISHQTQKGEAIPLEKCTVSQGQLAHCGEVPVVNTHRDWSRGLAVDN
ncbi:hypothetical protein L218DRAFT_578030 [Marasmius fiardii PR-910]|nr:hypothetical protein L218DRAFT_578030 [Marasmius fiardii PR-910]